MPNITMAICVYGRHYQFLLLTNTAVYMVDVMCVMVPEVTEEEIQENSSSEDTSMEEDDKKSDDSAESLSTEDRQPPDKDSDDTTTQFVCTMYSLSCVF